MGRTKQFLLDATATAEAASTVLMIAAVGLMLSVGLGLYYTGLNGFFGTVGDGAQTAGGEFKWNQP